MRRHSLTPVFLPLLLAVTTILAASCSSAGDGTTAQSTPDGQSGTVVVPSSISSADEASPVHTFTAEVWADNWFSLYVNGELVGEDSVPITTERSFNAETITFEASYPLTVAMISKDYIEDQSGLEYIGQSNQQIGDGGFIAQFTDDTSGRIVLTTSTDWRGLVVQTAPLNAECEKSSDPSVDCRFETLEEPPSWQLASFDESGWDQATEYTEEEVGTKDGYDTIDWDPSARLIWGSDLKSQNTILWRAPVVDI